MKIARQNSILGLRRARKAIAFAETMLREDWQKFDRENYKMTFGEYARDLFTDEDSRGFRKKEAKNKRYTMQSSTLDTRLDNCIMPKFGS